MRAPGVFSPLLSLDIFLRCQYQECDFLSEIVNLRRRLIRHEGDAFLALASLPAPRFRAKQPEIEPSAPRSPHQNRLPGWSMQKAVQSRGRSPLGAQFEPAIIPAANACIALRAY